MKRTVRWICILLILQMILTSCGVPGTPEQLTTVESPSGITQDTPKQPAEGTEGVTENTSPEAVEPTDPTESTEPTETAIPETTQPDPETPVPTEPQETESPTAKPTEPPATKPVATEPPVTKPTVTEPPVTEPPETEPPITQTPTEAPKPQIDMEVIEKSVEQYAESIGYVYDSSLQPGNCGYYPPEYWPLTSNQEGIQVGIGLLIATTHQLNSRYETEYGDELIEKFYGYVRVNCLVEFDHSDELGNWYTIYILYG